MRDEGFAIRDARSVMRDYQMPDASSDPVSRIPDPVSHLHPVWGSLATLLWAVLIAIVFLVVQVFAAGLYILVTTGDPGNQMAATLKNLEFDGTFLAYCTLASAVVCVPLIMGIARLKRGSNLKEYLGLKWPSLGATLRWSLITVALCLLNDAIFLALGRPIVPEFMLKSYASASPRWILWLALLVGAPIFEEICFRGFIFKGLAASRARWYGATIVTAMFWAAIHLQYGWFEIVSILGLGLLLGIARAMTGSTVLTIWLHSLINILATAQTVIALRQL
jgi:membrane protease YdiL (CAAX protease family)